tara:strand:+ start:8232 stop:11267 length:3036 start_codon:yes stop_codon:yes gene_type:complete
MISGYFKRNAVLAVSILGLLVLLPNIVNAQGSAINGTVSDTSGGVLPGVTVEARSPAIIEQVRATVTDGNGQYQIIGLEPGSYDVTYTLPGFNTLVREGIELSIGFTASIDAELAVGSIEETVTVSGASPVVDIQNVEQRQVINREVIDSVPTGKSFQSYALLVPGMTASESYLTPLSTDQGGMSPATLQRMQMHGSSENDQQLEINGMDVGDSLLQGSNYSVFPDSNFEELSVQYSGNSAEIETGGVRINMIPREGANEFSGHMFTTFTFPSWNANNVDQDLIDRGLGTGTFIDEVWTMNPVIGGPIVKDKLWFFLTHTSGKGDLVPANLFNAVNPSALVYVPDESSPSLDETTIREQSINLTWQASSKDKLKFYWTNSSTDKPHLLQGRTLSTIFIAPEAAISGVIRTNSYQATWTRPQTNRLLFEAGVSHQPVRYQLNTAENAAATIPGVLEFSPVMASRNMSGWFSGTTARNSPKHTNFVRGSVSFVTGSHNLKVGMTSLWLGENTFNSSENQWRNINTYGGFPIRASFHTPGIGMNRARSTGLYVQEQWTLDRLTVNAGLRYDYFNSTYPDQISPVSAWAPTATFIEGQTAVSWSDIQPRIGIAYDLFGNGKTALKISANRYGARESTDPAVGLNPGQTNNKQTRNWNDGYTGCVSGTCIVGDGIPQGDPLNPAANGELMSVNTNLAFGIPIVNTFYDAAWSRGWGNRKSNWNLSISIQQELVNGASLDVGYFRRNYFNHSTSDDRAITAAAFDTVQMPLPNDPNIPNSGQMITLFDQRPETIVTADRLTGDAEAFGGMSEAWHGLDITANAQLEGFIFQGGVSTGQTMTDNCSIFGAMPENYINTSSSAVQAPIEYCDADQNWLTQVKFLTSYTLPYDIQIAGTLQNQNGPMRLANVTYSSASISAALGRPATSGNQTINALEPGTAFGDRFTQFDLRFTKIFTLGGGTRLRTMFDIFNLFNANAITREQPGCGNSLGGACASSWLAPQVIMAGRLAKVAFQFDF